MTRDGEFRVKIRRNQTTSCLGRAFPRRPSARTPAVRTSWPSLTGRTSVRKAPSPGMTGLSLVWFPNKLAAHFYSAIVISVADVLEQMRHFWKRAPLAIFGQVFLTIPRAVFSFRHTLHGQKLRDPKMGSEAKIWVLWLSCKWLIINQLPEWRNGRRTGLKNPLWAVSTRCFPSLAICTKSFMVN